MSKARVSCNVFIDFDGTIAPCDATDFLFERFADPSWHDIESDWQAGKIGSRECMTRQVALLRATPDAMRAAVSELKVDRGFVEFVAWGAAEGIAMSVVSDGFDFAIETVLRNAGVKLPFYANQLEPTGTDRWRLAFPHARSECASLAGNCKCAFTEPHAGSVKVVIGDGRSDFCVSQRADLVFAKGRLLELCREQGNAYFAFEDFVDVHDQLATWLRQSRDRNRPAADGRIEPRGTVRHALGAIER